MANKKKTTTKKTTATKKTTTKKVVKKEPVKVEEEVVSKAKLEPIKVEKEEKKQRGRLLSYKQTAILYFICSACWFISGILNYMTTVSPKFDILMGFVFLIIGLLYAANIKKDK